MATSDGETILVGTATSGLFLSDGDTVRPFVTEADEEFKNALVFKSLWLADGPVALGTREGGGGLLDRDGRLLGRLTLNPLAHLDPLGSILFLLPPHIGWAKPVPVDERNLSHPRRDMMWIALAGPVSNVILDGKPLGQTPKVGVSVSPGSHTVIFVHPEHGRKAKSVTAEAGKTAAAIVRFP